MWWGKTGGFPSCPQLGTGPRPSSRLRTWLRIFQNGALLPYPRSLPRPHEPDSPTQRGVNAGYFYAFRRVVGSAITKEVPAI